MRCLWGVFLEHRSSSGDSSLVQCCAVIFLGGKCLIWVYVQYDIRLEANFAFNSSIVKRDFLLNICFANMSLWDQMGVTKFALVPGGNFGLARNGVSGLSHGVGFVFLAAF